MTVAKIKKVKTMSALCIWYIKIKIYRRFVPVADVFILSDASTTVFRDVSAPTQEYQFRNYES